MPVTRNTPFDELPQFLSREEFWPSYQLVEALFTTLSARRSCLPHGLDDVCLSHGRRSGSFLGRTEENTMPRSSNAPGGHPGAFANLGTGAAGSGAMVTPP
jgi:hypothetical protein